MPAHLLPDTPASCECRPKRRHPRTNTTSPGEPRLPLPALLVHGCGPPTCSTSTQDQHGVPFLKIPRAPTAAHHRFVVIVVSGALQHRHPCGVARPRCCLTTLIQARASHRPPLPLRLPSLVDPHLLPRLQHRAIEFQTHRPLVILLRPGFCLKASKLLPLARRQISPISLPHLPRAKLCQQAPRPHALLQRAVLLHSHRACSISSAPCLCATRITAHLASVPVRATHTTNSLLPGLVTVRRTSHPIPPAAAIIRKCLLVPLRRQSCKTTALDQP